MAHQPSSALDTGAPVKDGLWSPKRRALSLGMVFTITLLAFEALAVGTVMPAVAVELHGLEFYGWAFSAFFLGDLVGIVVAGGLIDRTGLARPFVAGLVLFAIGLIVCGVAPTMGVLVAGRFLQGLGAGAIPPTAYVAIGRSLPERLRPQMFATLSTAWVLPGVIGPALAGGITQMLGWRAVFLGLLPLVLLAGAMTLRSLIAVPGATVGTADAEQAAHDARRRRLPLALVLALGAALVLGGLTTESPPLAALLIATGLVLVVPAFRRLTPVGTLRAAHGLPAAILLRGVATAAFFAADAYVPLALQDWRGLAPAAAGIVLTAATLSWTAGSWLQARRFDQWGARRFVGVGFAVVMVGVATFGLVLIPDVPVLVVGIPTWAIAGLGMGLLYAPLSLVTLREAPADAQGAATSALQLSDILGTSLGAGVGGGILAAGVRGGVPQGTSLAITFTVAVVAAAGGVLLAARLPGARRAEVPAPAPDGAIA
jgi:MFS family permease